MSEQPERAVDAGAQEIEPGALERRSLPVLAEPRPIERPLPPALPATIAAAAGGFLMGVATFVLVRVLRRPRGVRVGVRGRKRDQVLDVAGTRSFLVDIHLLKR